MLQKNENRVALTWPGPDEKLGSEESSRMNEKFPDRFVPNFISPILSSVPLPTDAAKYEMFVLKEREKRVVKP